MSARAPVTGPGSARLALEDADPLARLRDGVGQLRGGGGARLDLLQLQPVQEEPVLDQRLDGPELLVQHRGDPVGDHRIVPRQHVGPVVGVQGAVQVALGHVVVALPQELLGPGGGPAPGGGVLRRAHQPDPLGFPVRVARHPAVLQLHHDQVAGGVGGGLGQRGRRHHRRGARLADGPGRPGGPGGGHDAVPVQAQRHLLPEDRLAALRLAGSQRPGGDRLPGLGRGAVVRAPLRRAVRHLDPVPLLDDGLLVHPLGGAGGRRQEGENGDRGVSLVHAGLLRSPAGTARCTS